MSQWSIDPAGVQEVLTAVGEDNEDLGEELTEEKFTAVFEGLTWGAALTQDVPTSVQNLLNDQNNNLMNIVNRINAGYLGVFNATMAYQEGQLDMAAVYQSEGLESAESGDFSFFEENGYGSDR